MNMVPTSYLVIHAWCTSEEFEIGGFCEGGKFHFK